MAANHLKKITAKAKQIRKAHPKMKWTDAVKKASASIKGASKPAAKKRAVKKAAKKVATKKHVDTKNHNVNIRVVSGAKKANFRKPSIASNLQHYSWLVGGEKSLIDLIADLRKQKPFTVKTKALIRIYQTQLKAVKKQKAIQKKLI